MVRDIEEMFVIMDDVTKINTKIGGLGEATRYWTNLRLDSAERKYSKIVVETWKGTKEFKAERGEYLNFICIGKTVSIESSFRNPATDGCSTYQIAYFPEVTSVEATPIY